MATYLLQLLKSSQSESMAMQAHSLIIRLGMNGFFFLQTTLICLYSRTGRLYDAQKIFEEMPEKNSTTWTAVIAACVRNGNPATALKLFRRMIAAGVPPDEVSFTAATSACSDVGALRSGACIHALSMKKMMKGKKSFFEDLILRNSLIDLYGKCGKVEKARYLFDEMSSRDVTSFSSMIFGYAINGRGDEALALFEEMKRQKRSPNSVTFVGVLMACSHAGRVEDALRNLKSMWLEHRLKPRISHYGCVVDALCRKGLLQEAVEFAESMEISANAVIWRILFGACAKNGDIGAADQARKRLLDLDPEYVGDDVAMANAYAAKEMWKEKEDVRKRGDRRRRDPGRSMLEIEGRLHEFVAGDRRHGRRREILAVLRGIAEICKSNGDLSGRSDQEDSSPCRREECRE